MSPFRDPFSAPMFAFLCLFLAILLFKLASSIVPKHCLVFLRASRLGCVLGEKIALDKLHLGRSHGAVGCASNVNKTTIYVKQSLNTKRHQTRLCIS